MAANGFTDSFSGHTDVYEEEFKRRTVGLQTADEFRAKRRHLHVLSTTSLAPKLKKAKKKKGPLSFSYEEEEEDNVYVTSSLKDPSVDTTFLPDAKLEKKAEEKRITKEMAWLDAQDILKSKTTHIKTFCIFEYGILVEMKIQITFSFWDGSGHRKKIEVPLIMPMGNVTIMNL